MVNTLWFGDNLHVLRKHVKDETVDLVYLDPPFKSDSNFNVLFRSPVGRPSEAQAHAFNDTWKWHHEAELALDDVRERSLDTFRLLVAMKDFLGHSDVMAYLAMMAVRLLELRRVLKPTGSLYLHCDPTASHYLKILLDGIFGAENFRNEVVWKRTFSHGSALRWGDVHDILLFYTKSDIYTWNRVSQPYDDSYVDIKYRFEDDRGRYRLVVLTAPGKRNGASGQPWRSYDPSSSGRHWAVPQKALATIRNLGIDIPQDTHQQLELLYEHGLIRFPAKRDGSLGVPEFKLYLGDGQPIQDVINDIPPLNSQAKERLGYPTQKPVALLERLIEASSNVGDLILDPFCGCGTTVHAAQKLSRRWIGIDITHLAIQIIEDRLHTWLKAARYEVRGIPRSEEEARALAARDPYQFQLWAVSKLDGQPRGRGADRGVDGEIVFKKSSRDYGYAVISVKAGQNVNPGMVRDLVGTITTQGADAGVFVCLHEPTQEMRIAAAAAGVIQTETGKRPKVQIVTVGDLISGPRLGLGVTLNTIAAAQASKIKPKAPKQPKPEEPQFFLTLKGGKGRPPRPQSEFDFPEAEETPMLEAAEPAHPFDPGIGKAKRRVRRKA